MISSPSVPSHWLRAWKRPALTLKAGRTAITREWDSPLRLLLVVAVAGGLALLVPAAVVALALSSSPAWALLLAPCLAAWAGMVREFRARRPAEATEDRPAADEVEPAPPAAKAAPARSRRRKPQASPARKPSTGQA